MVSGLRGELPMFPGLKVELLIFPGLMVELLMFPRVGVELPKFSVLEEIFPFPSLVGWGIPKSPVDEELLIFSELLEVPAEVIVELLIEGIELIIFQSSRLGMAVTEEKGVVLVLDVLPLFIFEDSDS